MKRRVYHSSPAARISATILVVGLGWPLIAAAFGARWIGLGFIAAFGAFTVLFTAPLAAYAFLSTTVASDAGVRPSWSDRRVIPWAEIGSFSVRPLAKTTDLGVFLVPADGGHPVKLGPASGSRRRANSIAAELNAILQEQRKQLTR